MTTTGQSVDSSPYESSVLEQATGGMMRPGGLDLTARAMDYCAFAPGSRIVDVGCGTGVTVEYLCHVRELDAIGVDSSSILIERGLQRNTELRFIRSGGEKLPIPSGTMDGILVECSLSVITNRQQALAEFCRVLTPDGKLIITDLYVRGTPPKDIGLLPASSCFAGMMTREQLLATLSDHGFAIELWEDHSDKLQDFVIRMIMEHGSLQSFWGCECGADDPRIFTAAAKALRPGYFVLIANKHNHQSGVGYDD
jgi:arsenite methyltransferase